MKTVNLSAESTEYNDGNLGAIHTLVMARHTSIVASVLFEEFNRNGEFMLSIDIAIPEGEAYGTVANIVIRENGGVEMVKNDN
jgi:hypothetical protein